MESYTQLVNDLQQCIDNGDTEMAHGDGDEILCRIALDTELTRKQRRILVDLYLEIPKWYA